MALDQKSVTTTAHRSNQFSALEIQRFSTRTNCLRQSDIVNIRIQRGTQRDRKTIIVENDFSSRFRHVQTVRKIFSEFNTRAAWETGLPVLT